MIFEKPKSNTNFIKGSHVEEGPLQVTIREVVAVDGTVFDNDGNETDDTVVRPLLHFDGTDLVLECKPFNHRVLHEEWGGDSDDWLGKTILIKEEVTGKNAWAKVEIIREVRKISNKETAEVPI